MSPETREAALSSNAWPFQEARRILERLNGAAPAKGYVLFETGYGPSGLPHLGTFGEVLRTTMIRRAFKVLSDYPTRLFAFSDDMDGLRKVPDNVPSKAVLQEFIGMPLTKVPDPFGTHASFGEHNNARLRAFLDGFGFEYDFLSATECYGAGRFDVTLLTLLQRYDEVMAIMLPTLGPERRATYSPFLPIDPKTGRVLQVSILERKLDAGTVVFKDEQDHLVEVPVTGGHCKLQWKADWAMRWAALDVDYEMSGKDLIDSVKQSSRIARVLGKEPPLGFTYELFLDANGEKISKSRGNGLTIEEWLRYASPESLALFMYREPKKAKRLHFDVIPRAMDDYLAHLVDFGASNDPAKRLSNPAWHIHDGNPPAERPPITFGVLLNLVGVCHSEDKAVVWGFISRYAPGATPENYPILDKQVGYAINYYRDFVKPTNSYRRPTAVERAALEQLAGMLPELPDDAEALQNAVYEIGKRHAFANLRDWFKAMYEVLFGQSQGPRMGSFIALYGRQETVALIRRALAGEQLAAE